MGWRRCLPTTFPLWALLVPFVLLGASPKVSPDEWFLLGHLGLVALGQQRRVVLALDLGLPLERRLLEPLGRGVCCGEQHLVFVSYL